MIRSATGKRSARGALELGDVTCNNLRELSVSFPLGVLTYMIVGIHLARTHNLSRFYSWPFGGEHIAHDGPLVASGLFWMAIWFVLLFSASSLLLKASNADRR